MTLLAQLDSDIKDAMRAKAMDRLTVIRGLKSAIKAAAIEKGLSDDAMAADTATCTAIIRKELKKRQDSIAAFEATRPDLADKEKAEAEVIAGYLPKPLTAEEMEALVKSVIAELGATSKAQMGAVMKAAGEKADGRADGKTLSGLVSKLLQ
jgi:hypothetical protein